MTTSGKGGVYSGQPVDITVHVVREAGGGGAASIPGNVSGMSSGQRNPPRSTQEPIFQGMPKGGGWDTILKGNGRGSMGPEAPSKQQGMDISGMFALAKKWLPGLAGVATVAGILKKSSLFGESLSMIFDTLGMIVDVILMPFLMPLMIALMPLIGLMTTALNKYLNFMKPGDLQQDVKDSSIPSWQKSILGPVAGGLNTIPGMGGIHRAAENFDTPEPPDDPVTGKNKSHWGGWKLWASGVGYVDNTGPAMLHRGERVMTAAENSGGGSGHTFNNKFDILVSNNVDASLLDARIADRLQTRLGNKFRRS